MNTFVRNRSSNNYGNPSLLLPYQAVMWFSGGKRLDIFHEASKFHGYLLREKGWSSGALGRVAPQLVDTKMSVGILFGHRKYADEAREIYASSFVKAEAKEE